MIRVLIVEDEPALARGLSLLITKNYTDFEVLGICKNGRDGLHNILKLEPELVFTDITMPVMNGLDRGSTESSFSHPFCDSYRIC